MAGLNQVKRNAQAAFTRMREQAAAGVHAGAETVAERALRMTPVRTGKLRGSQVVSDGEGGRNPQSVVAYTDPKAPRVHEKPFNYRVGSHKFLERAAYEGESELAEVIGRKLKV
ncbi:MAG TPA: hypothetical protein PK847_11950, partial [Candidatus Sumerlaeota bacterium]|nr:hypothetical protein [Candidatus Sumerlaeota bacterium]HOR28366.1 hypothetical protein [Candidatus Sumerlaeota bacterium]